MEQLEAVLVAESWKQVSPEVIQFFNPILYLVNADRETDFGSQKLENLDTYADHHPLEIARWKAQSVEIVSTSELQVRGAFSLDHLKEMTFRGNARLEFGYGELRSAFEAPEIHLKDQHFVINHNFKWETPEWTIQGNRARGSLKKKELSNKEQKLKFPSYLQSIEIEGDPIRVRGNIVSQGQSKGNISYLEIRNHLTAAVSGDEVNFSSPDSLKLIHPEMTVLGVQAQGRLSPEGWQWLKLEEPDVQMTQAAAESLSAVGEKREMGTWNMKGRSFVLSQGKVTIEGDPITLTNDKMTLYASQARRDLLSGRIRFKNMRVKPQK